MNDNQKPCKCINNFAYIAPTHEGHCCFIPSIQDCHQDEVKEWENKRVELNKF